MGLMQAEREVSGMIHSGTPFESIGRRVGGASPVAASQLLLGDGALLLARVRLGREGTASDGRDETHVATPHPGIAAALRPSEGAP